MTGRPEPGAAQRGRRWSRLLLLPVLIGCTAAAVWVFDLGHYLSFASLADNHAWLRQQVAENLLGAAAAFTLVYAVVAALSLPGAAIMTMAAGLLFGPFLGAALAVAGASAGATLLFLIARTSLGELLRGRAEGTLARLRDGFRKDAFNYLLFLRLVPLFPFWLINLVAAFLDIRLRTFVLGTVIGIIPGAAIYAGVGNGIGSILESGQTPDADIILSSPVLIPLLALAALSLVPIIYRRMRRAPEETTR
ncbi:VTT domain-containing protein [Emcibacter sp. SYSU 3D8]|uniref:TVP38/TMEM64 family protein n=1 Tax=Emcibacter sp. SYSU 3D8 TaxID=3133969 RepID=UPI0031FE465F